VSATGVVTGLAAGTAQVTATASGVSGTVTVTVTGVALVNLLVSPANASIPVLSTQQYTCTGIYADGSSADLTAQVTWGFTSDAPASITAGGLLTPSGSGSGTLLATDTASERDGSTNFYIGVAAPTGLVVKPASATLAAGQSVQLNAYAWESGQLVDVTNSTSWNTPETGLISNSGNTVFALSPGGPTAVTANYLSFSAQSNITVTAATVVGLRVGPANATAGKGAALQFAAALISTDGSTTDVTSTVTWASDAPSTVSIDSSGLAHALAIGSANISATGSGGRSDATKLTVVAPFVQSIALSPPVPSVLAGDTLQLAATGILTDGTSAGDITSQVTWSTNGPSVVTVDASGLATSHAVGTATLTATYAPNGASGHTNFYASAAGAPRLTGVPVISPSVVTPGQPFTVTLPVSANTTAAYGQLYSVEGSTRSTSGNATGTDQVSLTFQNTAGCVGAGETAILNVTLNSASGQTQYSFNAQDTYYISYQYTTTPSYSSFTGYSSIPVAFATIGSVPTGTCAFPTMSGAPDIDAGGSQPVQGGVSVIPVASSPNADMVTVSLADWPALQHSYGRGIGYYDGGSMVNVPVQMTCLGTAPLLTAIVDVQDTPHSLFTEYYFDNTLDAGTLQAYYDDFGHGSSASLATSSIPPSISGETLVSNCPFPALTGPPVFASATADAGQPLIVSVPVNDSVRRVYVALYEYQSSYYAGAATYPPDGGFYDGGTPDGAVEVTIQVNPSAPKTSFYPYVNVQERDSQYYSNYLRYAPDSGTYSVQQYDPNYGYASGQPNTYLDAGIAIPLVTVQ
jgi:hypothetical protein